MSELHSLKYWLLNYLLNDSGATLNSRQIKSFSSMTVSLQTITSILDDIEFIQHKRHCVTLTETHYEKIFHAKYDNTSLLDVMLTEMKNWLTDIKQDIALPTRCICENVFDCRLKSICILQLYVVINCIWDTPPEYWSPNIY